MKLIVSRSDIFVDRFDIMAAALVVMAHFGGHSIEYPLNLFIGVGSGRKGFPGEPVEDRAGM
jgi:hypothetical protein